MDRKKMRVCLYSLGCKVNGYETERMAEEFKKAGHTVVPPFEMADVYIINTCTVTNIADRKSRKMLRHAAKVNPDAVIVAVGCYVDAEKQFGARAADENVADLWVVNKEKEKIVPMVEEYLERRQAAERETDNDTKKKNQADAEENSWTDAKKGVQTDGEENSRIDAKKGVRIDMEEDARKDGQEDTRFDVQEELQSSGHTRAYLKIQDGCNQFCSYCIIPFARGRVVSRKPEEILAEARQLAAAGYREIVLTGIHISSYGLDFQKKDKDTSLDAVPMAAGAAEDPNGTEISEYVTAMNATAMNATAMNATAVNAAAANATAVDAAARSGKVAVSNPVEESAGKTGPGSDEEKFDLTDLVREICTVDGTDRVRLGSMEPRIITEKNIQVLAGLKKVCPHFHLSLQSGCDATLRRMNRHYTTAEYMEKCEIIRRHFPDAAITTDVIVGFPGETEEEFETTREFLARVRFARMHIFKYSARRGTRAAAMDHQIPEPVKDARSAILRKLNLELEEEFAHTYFGQTVEVLFEETVRTSEGRCEAVGHTAQYLKVGVTADKDLSNQILPVCITGKMTEGGEVRLLGEIAV